MSNYSGNDAIAQLGLESTYGTAPAAQTLQLEFLSESLHQVNTSVESEALVGAVTTPYYKVVGKKVEGDVSIECHPDKLGLVIGCTVGAEADAAIVGATSAYDHVFTPISGGDSLPSLTMVVDKKADEFTYTGLKIDTLTFETDPSSLLTSTISFIGQKEVLTGASASLSVSSLPPFDFNDMAMYVGTADAAPATPFVNGTSFSFSYSNNLETDLFVADGTEYMAEIDYQKRDITFDVEALYDDVSNTLRETYYKTGDKLSFKVVFTSSALADDSPATPYSLTIEMKNVVIVEAPNDVSGAERLSIPLSFRALQVGSTPAVTITLRDASDIEYLG